MPLHASSTRAPFSASTTLKGSSIGSEDALALGWALALGTVSVPVLLPLALADAVSAGRPEPLGGVLALAACEALDVSLAAALADALPAVVMLGVAVGAVVPCVGAMLAELMTGGADDVAEAESAELALGALGPGSADSEEQAKGSRKGSA